LRTLRVLGGSLIALILFSGCSSSTSSIERRKAPERSLIFGSIAFDKGLEGARLSKFGGGSVSAFRQVNGLFVFDNLEEGRYTLTDLASGGETFTLTPDMLKDNFGWDVMPGQVVFAGSYEAVGSVGNFQIQARPAPSERDLLESLVRLAQGTGWEDQVGQRLARLQKVASVVEAATESEVVAAPADSSKANTLSRPAKAAGRGRVAAVP
jgi:hypothetical protein